MDYDSRSSIWANRDKYHFGLHLKHTSAHKGINPYIYIYIHTHIYTYIHIYIYTGTSSQKQVPGHRKSPQPSHQVSEDCTQTVVALHPYSLHHHHHPYHHGRVGEAQAAFACSPLPIIAVSCACVQWVKKISDNNCASAWHTYNMKCICLQIANVIMIRWTKIVGVVKAQRSAHGSSSSLSRQVKKNSFSASNPFPLHTWMLLFRLYFHPAWAHCSGMWKFMKILDIKHFLLRGSCTQSVQRLRSSCTQSVQGLLRYSC